jgi:xanthine/CO dehydrogenase XdhC/CoxF family maturation factor
MTLDVLREAARLIESGEPVGLATIVATRGSTPQKVGARLVARAGQRLAGTLGGGAVEAESIQEATQAVADGRHAFASTSCRRVWTTGASRAGARCWSSRSGSTAAHVDGWRG